MEDDTSSAIHTEARRLAAIMFTDIVGFSRQMGADETRMLRLLEIHNQIIQQAVAERHGTVIKTVGDAFLVDFPSVVHAVQCAQRIQGQFRTYNAEKEPSEQTHVRIGIHSGDIVQRDGDVFGDGVNVASRLQELAAADTICISQKVYEEVEKKLSLHTAVLLGRPKLKNIAQRFQVYALLPEKPAGFRQRLQVHRLKLKQWQRTLQVAALLVLLASAGLIGRYVYVPSPAGLPLPDKPSIVVLPFVNMSEDPGQEYFSDGITEDLTTDLSKISGLFIIARNSAFTYKGKPVKAQDVSKELGVRYVLEGSVRKADNQVRINAQLIDGTTGGHLWSERYDRPLQDIFTLQDEITQQIATALRTEVLEAEQKRIRRMPTENLNAYETLLRAQEYSFRFTKEANAQARQMLERAIELDPTYATAYTRLGWIYFADWALQWSQDSQTLERAFDLGQKAVALDDSLPHVHLLLGYLYLWKDRQPEQAIAEGERAIALDPNYAEGYAGLANMLTFAGRPEEAIRLLEKGMRLNPRGPRYVFYLFELGHAYHWLGQYEKAIATQQRVLALNPRNFVSHLELAVMYNELGREEEARAEVAAALKLNPQYSLEDVKERHPYKDPAALERILAGLRKAGLK